MKEFSDFVDAGVALLAESDNHRWQLGDLAAEFEVTVGRPDDPDAPTLKDLADAWNVDTPRVSEWRNCSRFYPPEGRGLSLTWSHYNMVRGYFKGRDYDPTQYEQAMEILTLAVDQAFGIRALRQYLNGTLFEGKVLVRELPERVRLFCAGSDEVWITVKRVVEDE